MSWNSLPNSLCESACDDNISDDCFKHSLKTFLFSEYWRTERSRGVHDSALYKSTYTLLTYLLMYSMVKITVTMSTTNLYQSSMMTFPKTSVTSWITTDYCKIAGKNNKRRDDCSHCVINSSIVYQYGIQNVAKTGNSTKCYDKRLTLLNTVAQLHKRAKFYTTNRMCQYVWYLQ